MRTIDDINFEGQRALIRVDFNVPLNDQFQITDDTRIQAALPTIQKILSDGGSVVLMSHLGRPKNGPEDAFSLRHLVDHLSAGTGVAVQFADDCIGEDALAQSSSLQAGQVLLLENLRFYKEETAGDVEFAKKLSQMGDIYVNDAFGTAHRAHASTAVIAQFFPGKKYFGYVMAGEIENVQKVLDSNEHPVVAILGGAKVSSKITIIEKLLPKVDAIIVGGGMSYTFAKANGGQIGNSLVEEEHFSTVKHIEAAAAEHNVTIHLPVDSVNGDQFSNEAQVATTSSSEVPDGWMGLDIGPETTANYSEVIKGASTILWNGPMGVFEMDKFAQGTIAIGEAICQATEAGSFSLVGGGDSVAAAKQFGFADRVSYVSTGGGAMLEYLEGKELPGIAAVLND